MYLQLCFKGWVGNGPVFRFRLNSFYRFCSSSPSPRPPLCSALSRARRGRVGGAGAMGSRATQRAHGALGPPPPQEKTRLSSGSQILSVAWSPCTEMGKRLVLVAPAAASASPRHPPAPLTGGGRPRGRLTAPSSSWMRGLRPPPPTRPATRATPLTAAAPWCSLGTPTPSTRWRSTPSTGCGW